MDATGKRSYLFKSMLVIFEVLDIIEDPYPFMHPTIYRKFRCYFE